jgi:hypothetical protein
MYRHAQLSLAALVAVVVCSIAAGSASANRSIEVRGGSGISASGRITGGDTEGTIEITCDITLLRTVTSLVPKTSGTQFGKVTGVAIDRGESRAPHCRFGGAITGVNDIVPLQAARTACTHRELGRGLLLYDCSRAEARLWALIYDSFQGTLPRIEGVNVHMRGYQDNITATGPFGEPCECLYEGEVFALLPIRQPEATANSARVVEATTRLNRVSGSGICPARVTFAGTFTVAPTITIRLI